MKLVYLYIEKYKNIEKQGFNFSSEFNCKYKDGVLTVDKNDRFRKSIFPDNVNITAIVGKNGSGKSSVLENIINDIPYCKLYDINANIIDKETFLEQNVVLLYNEDIDSNMYQNKYNLNQIVKDKFELSRYGYSNVAISFLLNNNQDFLSHFSFIPDYIQLEPIVKLDENDFTNLLHRQIEYIDDMLDARRRFNIDVQHIKKVKNYIQKKLDDALDEIYEDISYYLYIREFIYKLNHDHSKAFGVAESIIMDYIDGDVDFKSKLYKELYNTESEQIFNEIISEFKNSSISFEFYSKTFNVKIDDKNIEKLLLNIHRQFFNIYFYKKLKRKNIYFNDLSNGEQKLILLFAKLFYIIRKLYKDENQKIFYILLDEPDIYLHPEWQKKIVDFFILFVKNVDILKDKIFHIIFTTHSPFILSDIPKENIIFLKDGKNVSDEVEIDTFGANIHTLLSHGFFMEDGLMGEFAKKKIDEVIKLLNSVGQLSEDDVKKCEEIISIVGEPILKRQLQKMLQDKQVAYLSKDVTDEIAFLKHRIDLLSKRK